MTYVPSTNGLKIISTRLTVKIKWVTPTPADSFLVAASEESAIAGLIRNQLTATAATHSAIVIVIQGMDARSNLLTPAIPIPTTHNTMRAGNTSFMCSAAMALV